MGLHSLILIASVLAATATVLLSRLDKPHNLKLLTAFTGSYLMGLTCLHLLPEVFVNGFNEHSESNWQIGAFILAGFFVQVILENFSRGLALLVAHLAHAEEGAGSRCVSSRRSHSGSAASANGRAGALAHRHRRRHLGDEEADVLVRRAADDDRQIACRSRPGSGW